jgi:hypothetical protein
MQTGLLVSPGLLNERSLVAMQMEAKAPPRVLKPKKKRVTKRLRRARAAELNTPEKIAIRKKEDDAIARRWLPNVTSSTQSEFDHANQKRGSRKRIDKSIFKGTGPWDEKHPNYKNPFRKFRKV